MDLSQCIRRHIHLTTIFRSILFAVAFALAFVYVHVLPLCVPHLVVHSVPCTETDTLPHDCLAGIFVFTCAHGVVLGFHVIPVGEGRNDAFTPLATRFPKNKEPLYVVYDFSCQLME